MVEKPPSADAPRWPSVAALLRDGGRPLALLLLIALLLKLAVAIAAPATDPLAAHPTSDARYYLDRALGLAGVIDDPLADEAHHLPPLYPWLLRFVPGVREGALGGVRVAQALMGTALLAGVYVLARRRSSHGAALLAVVLVLAYRPLSFYETRVLGDSLACALLVGLLVAADAFADRGGASRAALIGGLTGLCALLRPQALLLVPVLAVWALRRERRAGLALVGSAVLLLLPSALHNARATGDLILVSDNGGVNLWLAQTGPPTGTFMAMDEAFGDIAGQADAARGVAEELAGRPLSAGEVSSTLAREALASIARQPGDFLLRVGRRARALIESVETDIVCFPDVEGRLIPPLLPLVLPFGVLLGLAAAARLLGARFPAAPGLPALAVAGMVVLTALLFFHYSRFRLPLVPLLALVVATGWDRVREGPVALGRCVAAGSALAGIVIVSLLPAPHHAPMRANAWTSLAGARMSAIEPGDRAEVQAAHRELLRALEWQPGFVRALMLAARTAMLLGQYEESWRHVGKVERAGPGYPPALLQKAWLHTIGDPGNPYHDPDAARGLLPALRAAARDDPSLARGVADLERALGV
ncbi:MAG: glycosyltransferase family 39 protein [Planctomycetota bacterium]|jgi:hypothetical protein